MDQTHEAAKAAVTEDLIRHIQEPRDPLVAATRMRELEPEAACAVLDAMNIILAALLFGTLKLQAEAGEEKAGHIVRRAESLGLEATKGVCNARDRFFEDTGRFIA